MRSTASVALRFTRISTSALISFTNEPELDSSKIFYLKEDHPIQLAANLTLSNDERSRTVRNSADCQCWEWIVSFDFATFHADPNLAVDSSMIPHSRVATSFPA